jgi:lysozyme
MRVYNCPANDGSIAYGHLVHHGPVCGAASEEAPFAGGITEAGKRLAARGCACAEHAVEHLVTVPLSQGQYDGLVSFSYNEGAGRLQTSTL